MRARRPILAAVLLALLLGGCRHREVRFDDVVLVTIDTLRADHLGAYGYPRATTPFLDGLAALGLRFTHAYTSISHTAPAHASILTGLYPSQHQVLANGMGLESSIESLVDAMHGAGYDTAAFVSVAFLGKIGGGFDHLDNELAGQSYRRSEATIEAATRWLAERKSDRPLFLWVHVYDPHEHAPNARIDHGRLAEMELDFAARRDVLFPFLVETHGWDPVPDDERIVHLNRYDAQIAHTDAKLADLHRAIEDPGRARPSRVGDDPSPDRRTLWVVTSDHGEALGDHDYLGHGKNLYREQMQVPLIIASRAGWWKPGVVDTMVRHIDLFPTLAELLGIELDGERLRLEGVSLAAIFDQGGAPPAVDHALFQRRPVDEQRKRWGWEPGVVAAIQTRDAKYVWRSEGQHEFYDLTTDPYELENRIDQESIEKDRLLGVVETELRRVTRDHRVDPKGQFIDQRYHEDLKALGYL